MNPWEIVSWIGAASVAIFIIALTLAVVRGLFSQKPRYRRKDSSSRIL